MNPRILVETSPGEARVAVVSDSDLLDYALWWPGVPDGVGDLYVSRVIARVPAMAGAFIALPGAEGFLPDAEGGKTARDGDLLLVRVTRAAQGGKGPRLTARLAADQQSASGNIGGPPRLLRRGSGAVAEFAAQYADAPVLVDDPALLANLRPVLGQRIAPVRKAFDDDLAQVVADLASPAIDLPGGARLHFWPTPALTAIDVDAGGASAERRDKRAAQETLNRSVIPALARQIRLRNLSGAILVDFAGMAPRRRASLGPALAAALADDPLRPRLLGFTALGLAEICTPARASAVARTARRSACRRLGSPGARRTRVVQIARACPRAAGGAGRDRRAGGGPGGAARVRPPQRPRLAAALRPGTAVRRVVPGAGG